MLPRPTAENFPDELKRAREARGFSYKQLAKLCNISEVMPSRYENRAHGNFGPPSEKTWEKLNEVLFGVAPSTHPRVHERKYLDETTIEELIQALKTRGATSVSVTF